MPLRASALVADVAMVPGPDGGVYVAVATYDDPDDGNGSTILAAYDGDGGMRSGWPIAVSGADRCSLHSAGDGTVRAVCETRAFAFDSAGRSLPGWPVDLPGYVSSVRLVDGELYLHVAGGLSRIDERGTLSVGVSLTPPSRSDECWGYEVLGADGSLYVVTRCLDPAKDTTISAFDLGGARPGWPIRVTPDVSDPVIGPEGRVYVLQQASTGGDGDWPARVLVFTPDGRPLAGWLVPPAEALLRRGGGLNETAFPAPPLIAEDGSSWAVADTVAYAFDAAGHVRPGWPYRSTVGLGDVAYCGPCSMDCIPWQTEPLLGPDDVLYLLQGASSATVGGQITAIGLDGKVRGGWPVVLGRPGAEFWSAAAGSDGTLYALAIEPEQTSAPTADPCTPPPASATILAIGPDGEVRYRVTLVEP